MASRWPKEAPLFQVIGPDGVPFSIGDLVIGVDDRCPSRCWGRNTCIAVQFPEYENPHYAYVAWHCDPRHLKPLTPAARDMLAIAKADAK